MDIKEKLDKMILELKMANAIKKGQKTIVNLGGEHVFVNTICDGEKAWCEIVVHAIEYIKDGVYKKTQGVYNVPQEKVVHGHISANVAIEIYADYLVSSNVEYVDKNNQPVVYDGNKTR